MKRVTALNAVLGDWDEEKLPNGDIKYISVAFITKKGKFIYIKRGVKAGLKFSMKENDMKAILPVDEKGDKIDHVYPVWIHSIVYYKGNIYYSLLDNE